MGFDDQAANLAYQNHGEDYYDVYPNATNREASEYALLKMYGSAINMTRQAVNSNNSNTELKLNPSGQVVSNNPCP